MFGDILTSVVNITSTKISLCTWWPERRWPDLDWVSPRNSVTLHGSSVHCLVATVLEWFSCCVCSEYSINSSQACRHLSFDLYFFSFMTFYSAFFFIVLSVSFNLTMYSPQILSFQFHSFLLLFYSPLVL